MFLRDELLLPVAQPEIAKGKKFFLWDDINMRGCSICNLYQRYLYTSADFTCTSCYSKRQESY